MIQILAPIFWGLVLVGYLYQRMEHLKLNKFEGLMLLWYLLNVCYISYYDPFITPLVSLGVLSVVLGTIEEINIKLEELGETIGRWDTK
ncbi:hypothetical protein A3L14_04140 [Thermococcus thioreducens]|uniref:Uncharacterized protein n=1 Tax=Thermococcus thioreducens TaxID=277988 RepID=A0A1I0P3C1_9EURY|nr:hypothetical protein A3L14_04140 [Thermococcus thioreducens]SEW08008.1 hypothetical protein SAMN05216170_1441 [Thermococcus thioreducens]